MPKLTLSFFLFAFLLCPTLPAANAYLQHNLVSDVSGLADHIDPNLVNPWGIAFSATGPFWLTDNRSGLSTVYNSAGVVNSLVIAVATHPTGIVQNPNPDFALATGQPAAFLFCTEEGTIAGWNSAVDPKNAIVKVDRSSSAAVYKGLARANTAAGALLYAANFSSGKIDVFDAVFNPYAPAGGFVDSQIPAGFAPFNIQAFGNKLYVTYALQDSTKRRDVPGAGNGYVDVFDVTGSLVQRLAAGGVLNSPWGIAIAPSKFGDFAGAVLVGNFGDGAINAFNATTGGFLGTLQDVNGKPLSIPGLWGLIAGNGGSGGDANAIYFAAGIGNGGPVQSHGLLGSLQAAPAVNPNGVVNGASFQLGTGPYTFATILGSNLSATTRSWLASDFVGNQLPTKLDGVSVTIDGNPAYISYVSPTQVNALLPNSTGPGQILTTSNGLSSSLTSAQFAALSPAFFQYGAEGYVTATHSNGTLIGPAGPAAGSASPAYVGETVILYGTGFGQTNPPIPGGSLVTAPQPLIQQPVITVGGMTAQILFGGLTAAGLYQFNINIPVVSPGNNAIVAQLGNIATPPVLINIQ